MSKPTVFFDLDGVLADFVGGALRFYNAHIPASKVTWDFPKQIGFSAGASDPAFWPPLGYDFWAGLPALEDGMELLRLTAGHIGWENIAIISSPCDTRGCRDGKVDWVAQWLPEVLPGNIFLGRNKALFAGRGKVLLDDYDPNVWSWLDHGGIAVRVPRPWNVGASLTTDGAFDVSDVFDWVKFAIGRASRE